MNRLPDILPLYYIADKDFRNIRPATDCFEWARWFADVNNRTVAKTSVLEIDISTIFLGLLTCSNNIADTSMDWMFETMVFGPPTVIEQLSAATTENVNSILAAFCGVTDFQRRYKTVEDARAGHDETVKFIRRVLNSRN